MTDFFDRYLEGILSEAECDDMLRRIDARPALLEEWLDQIRLDAELSVLLREREQPSLSLYSSNKALFLETIDRLSRVSQTDSPGPSAPQATSKPLKPFTPGQKTPAILLVAVAFCFVGWIGLSVLEMTGKTWEQLTGKVVVEKEESKIVATISETSDPVWGRDTAAYRRGEPLFSGPLTLLSGLFSLRLSDGTQVVVNGGTDFSIDSPNKISCRNGKMTFRVPPRTEKLTIGLPQCDVVVLGTQFGIETSNLQSEIHLTEGRIMLTGFRDDPSRTEYIDAGEAFRIDSHAIINRIPTGTDRWTSFEEMRHLDRESLDREGRRWRESRESRSEDPALLVAQDFEDGVPASPLAVSMIGGQSVEGRFPGKKAILFSDDRDRIELNGSVDVDELTLTTSIRLDRFDENSSTLFFSQRNVKGAAFWQILSSGQVVFGGANENRSRSFRSPVRLLREQLGTWIHLAIVIDPKQHRVTHYFNGRSVGTERIDEPMQIRIDDATIGRRPDDVQRRCFNGCMDEFRIYRRCLGPDEIRAIVDGNR